MDALENTITIRQLAERLEVTPAAVYAMRHRGTGPRGVRIGRTIRFRPADIEAWMKSREEHPAA